MLAIDCSLVRFSRAVPSTRCLRLGLSKARNGPDGYRQLGQPPENIGSTGIRSQLNSLAYLVLKYPSPSQ